MRRSLKKLMSALRTRAALHPTQAVLVMTGLVVCLFYGYSLGSGFAPYDDPVLIVGNPSVHSLGASWQYFAHPVSFTSDLRSSGETFYRPLFWLSLATDATVWGVRAFGFHLTNLVLHWLNGVLLYFVLRRLKFDWALALASVVVWLVLPVNSEAVAWISGRSYLLVTLFILTALLCAGRYVGGQSAWSLGGFVVAGSCALLAHEEGILLLPLTVLMVVALGVWRSKPAMILYGTATALDVAYVVGTHAAGVRGGVLFGTVSTVGVTLAKYVGWMTLPVRMSIERSTDTPGAGWSTTAVVALLAAVGAVAGVVLVRNIPARVKVGLGWMLICVLPFLGLVVIYQGMAERYAYLATMGLAVAVCAVCAAVPGRARTAVVGVVLIWVCWGAGRLEWRLRDWHDPVRLYASSLRATPRSFKLQYDLGAIYEGQGQYPEALRAYREALRSNINYQPAIAGMGNAYLLMNDPETARKFYEEALTRKNDDVRTINNYGTSLNKLGHLNDAKQQYMRAIALAPEDDTAYCDLATLFFDAGEPEVAETLFKKAIAVNGSDPLPYSNLGAIYVQQDKQGRLGRKEQALAMYRKVLELDPQDASAIAAVQGLRR